MLHYTAFIPKYVVETLFTPIHYVNTSSWKVMLSKSIILSVAKMLQSVNAKLAPVKGQRLLI